MPKPDAKPDEARAAETLALARFLEPAPPEPPQTQGQPRFRSPLDLAGAVFAVATGELEPTPGTIGFLDRLLSQVQRRPLVGETAALRSLAELPPTWRPDQARLWLTLAADAERLQAEPIGLIGDPSAVAEAVRLAHEARVVFEAPGFAAPGEVDRRLATARIALDAALARLATLRDARNLADDATRLLPAAVPLLDEAAELERPWLLAAAETAAVLDRLGRLDPAARPARPPKRSRLDGEARINLRDLANRVGALREALAPFEPAGIAARESAANRREPAPTPVELRAAQALLATPLPTAGGRVALWDSAIAAERRAVTEVLRLDAADAATLPPGALDESRTVALPTGPEPTPATLRRSRIMDPLLALAQPAEEGAERAAPDRSQATTPGLPISLGSDLAQACEGRAPAARDRLARLVPPWLAAPNLDAPDLDPTRRRRITEAQVLRHHLAARYAFEAGDAGGSEFAAEAARDFADPADPPNPTLALDVEPLGGALDPAHPARTLVITFRPVGGALPDPVRGEVSASGSPWLALMPGLPWPVGSGSPPDDPADPLPITVAVGGEVVSVPIQVRLRDEGKPDPDPIPPGLLVRARLGERTAHRFVPLTVDPASHRLRVALTADPAGTGPDLSEVRLRALQGKVPLYLSVRNPGVRDRQVVATLFDRRGPIPKGSVAVAVPAGGSTRLAFGPPSAKPEEGLGVIRGPLTVRLTDPTGLMAPIERAIPAQLADPARYVEARASFEPGEVRVGGRSRLTLRLRAVGRIDGPPCPVALTLTAGRVPGLLSPGEGKYDGELAKVGDEVVLSVDGIEVDRLADQTGLVDLAIDGLARALVLSVPFDATTATTPTLVSRPAVGLRLDPATRPGVPVRVGVDVDSPPEAGRVVVELGRPTEDGGFTVMDRREIDSVRGTVRLNPAGPDGALVFEATIETPTATLDIGTIRGQYRVQARLLDETNRTLATASTPINFDDSPPVGVEFVRPPKYGQKGGTVALRARAARVPATGFREVAFFVGLPTDGKRPAGVEVVKGRPIDPDGTTWVATVPLGDAKLGRTPVSVEFVTGVGLNQLATAYLGVVETIPPEPATVRGVVSEGSRPQVDFEVIVRDEKGVEKRRTKTGEAGRFVIADLPPGSYRLSAEKKTPPGIGSVDVTLSAGETRSVEIFLFRP